MAKMASCCRDNDASKLDNTSFPVLSNGRNEFDDYFKSDTGVINLANEMNKLSVQERAKVLDDIHGVAEVQEETPELISYSLKIFDAHCSNIPKSKRKALDRALFFKPTIEKDTKFKLMFLRADNFDPKMAAERMTKYFEIKRRLFAEEKLAKKITLDDLKEEEIEYLKSGRVLLLPQKDQSGRPVFCKDIEKCFTKSNPTIGIRAFWYLIMSIIEEDEEAQRKGVCNITCCPNFSGIFDKLPTFLEMKQASEIAVSIPFRTSSHHLCHQNSQIEFLQSAIGKAFGRQILLRLRAHFGSPIEIQYELMTFGIKWDSIAELLAGDTNGCAAKQMQQFVQSRLEVETIEQLAQEQLESESGIVLLPKLVDVLIGRGRPYQDFVGNCRLTYLVDLRMDDYLKEKDRFKRTNIFMDIIKEIQQSGGRFLNRIPGGWEVVSEKVTREKVSGVFRSKTLRLNAANENNADAATKAPTRISSSRMEDDSVLATKRLRTDQYAPTS